MEVAALVPPLQGHTQAFPDVDPELDLFQAVFILVL